MRLIDTSTVELSDFHPGDIPSYAVLSHTWGTQEVSFQSFAHPESKILAGYNKILQCCDIAAALGLRWLWCDTCCIDKTSSAELSEAINSMWKWYESSALCIAYLEDVNVSVRAASPIQRLAYPVREAFERSRWFTRGWTLQELLAPKTVLFYDHDWCMHGERTEISQDLSAITGISELHLGRPKIASVAAKMSWTANRKTTRPEDMAYCLIGLFDVHIPLIYGEGDNAFRRLQEEIIRSSDDESIFAWTDERLNESGMLAPSPAAFARSGNIIPFRHAIIRRSPYSITNFGLQIEVNSEICLTSLTSMAEDMFRSKRAEWKMVLCCSRDTERRPLMIKMNELDGRIRRMDVGSLMPYTGPLTAKTAYRTIHVNSVAHEGTAQSHGLTLVLRLTKNFEDTMTYIGIPFPYRLPIQVSMLQEGIAFTTYGNLKTIVGFRFTSNKQDYIFVVSFEKGWGFPGLVVGMFSKRYDDYWQGLVNLLHQSNRDKHYGLEQCKLLPNGTLVVHLVKNLGFVARLGGPNLEVDPIRVDLDVNTYGKRQLEGYSANVQEIRLDSALIDPTVQKNN